MEETILRLNYIAGTIAILMVPLWFFCFIVWRIQLRIEKREEFYDANKETVSTENQPNQNKLRALTKFRKFRKEIPEFQKAVREKLKTYDLVPTTIEKTMSPAQLFKSESPLWAHGQTIYYIQQVQELHDRIKHDKQKTNEFYKLFDDLLNSKTCYSATCLIEEM